MKVLYRLTSIPSINKIRPIEGDKLELIEFCMRSFVEGFWDIQPKVHFIIDKPTMELVDLCEKMPFEHTMETLKTDDWNTGNIASFHRQVDLAMEEDGPVLFLEDDYYFRPNIGNNILKGLQKHEFVSPYHHPDIEPLEDAVDGWQKIPSTTLTFATHSKYVVGSVMKAHGWADEPMWKELLHGVSLAQAVPSLATHMETPYLAPTMIWR